MALWRMRLLLRLMLPLLLLVGGARAQDVFDGGAIPNASADTPITYSDSFSTSCVQGEPPNPFRDAGMNPLICAAKSAPESSNKQCNLLGLKPLSHVGTTCYYCSPLVPPINGIILPFDQVGNAQHQGYTCGVDPIDPQCLAICSKTGPLVYTPVPVPVPLQATTTATAKLKTSTASPACPTGVVAYFWPAGQTAILQKAVADARTMLLKAKTYTDKPTWDAGTVAIAKKYFGNAAGQAAATQATMRTRVNGELALLTKFGSVNQSFYPGPLVKATPWDGATAFAWVNSSQGANPVIYVANLFWSAGTTGPDSQAATIVHELSHFAPGGSTGDTMYSEIGCQIMVMTNDAGQAIQSALGNKQPAPATNSATVNADSFEYFVYSVSQQK